MVVPPSSSCGRRSACRNGDSCTRPPCGPWKTRNACTADRPGLGEGSASSLSFKNLQLVFYYKKFMLSIIKRKAREEQRKSRASCGLMWLCGLGLVHAPDPTVGVELTPVGTRLRVAVGDPADAHERRTVDVETELLSDRDVPEVRVAKAHFNLTRVGTAPPI